MKNYAFTALLLIGLVLPALRPATVRADDIDNAEAKKRGVPVEVVQLESAKARIAFLEAQLKQAAADLAKAQADKAAADKKAAEAVADLEKLKAAMTPTQKTNVANANAAAKATADQQAVIAKAIKDHKLVNGMTVDQANQSLVLKIKFRKISESSDGEVWKAFPSTQAPLVNVHGVTAGGETTGTEYTLNVKDGHVTDWSSEPFSRLPGSFQQIR